MYVFAYICVFVYVSSERERARERKEEKSEWVCVGCSSNACQREACLFREPTHGRKSRHWRFSCTGKHQAAGAKQHGPSLTRRLPFAAHLNNASSHDRQREKAANNQQSCHLATNQISELAGYIFLEKCLSLFSVTHVRITQILRKANWQKNLHHRAHTKTLPTC